MDFRINLKNRNLITFRKRCSHGKGKVRAKAESIIQHDYRYEHEEA